ncbi:MULTISPECIES: hypothetical protein [Solidesulfovibrio]|jgi:hypothetical protein|uniref:hypothetical protein n=1 Tax=Solidesulfovibrio TaxID=2910984 RepID=UPI000498579B|nr:MULTISPECIES: hypothetical protein [Solidesulfovibrio]MEA5090436.1 hypothetical protein [Solidesulfovibrio sp.]HCR11941.1 hypothetical protein [Desulfovibrio sp.]HML62023.1 hypothetical protein [Solidesulfovibrio sp.]
MKRPLFIALVLTLALAAASAALAQTQLYCVKPDGSAVAAISLPYGDRHDPSVVCNAVVPQCYLTCSAVMQVQDGYAAQAANVPVIQVTQQMLQRLGNPAPETPAMCAQQYQQCVSQCRGDKACIAYCKSVRSGCGTGNRGQ